MKFNFTGEIGDLSVGLSEIAATLHFEIGADGAEIAVKKSKDGRLRVSNTAIEYAQTTHFFRAIGLLCEHWNEGEFKITEVPQFDTNGVMIDVSQSNAAVNIESTKDMLRRMAIMGLNTYYLYMEDTYEVPEEPYFGYLRPCYSQAELREIDDYAYGLGITVIPCIQTLAHLIDALKWPPYEGFQDDHDTLLVGDPRTYELLDHMLRSIRASVRSKKIHIGLDEAWKLGQGEYLLKNGYKTKYEIMREHLARLLDMCKEIGIEPMIWSDMFLKASIGSEDPNVDFYQFEGHVPDEVKKTIPRGVDYVFWDYGHEEESKYTGLIDRHREFTDNVVFAGAIWNWNSFAVDYQKTFLATNAGLMACKKCGLRDVFATTWGDGGAESNIFQILLGMQLYAEHGFHEIVTDEMVATRFKACTGCNFDDFYEMTYLDCKYGRVTLDGYRYTNPSRWLMWQDMLMGLIDKNIDGLEMSAHYEDVHKKMVAACKRNGDYNYIFEFLSRVTDVLRLKADIGLRIRRAYLAKDKKTLSTIVPELATLRERIVALHEYHRDLWFKTSLAQGWEILDLRYGGVIQRCGSVAKRLNDYIDGTISTIRELEGERLYYEAVPGLIGHNMYSRIPSASRISGSFGW